MTEPEYVELHCHSAFSLLDGASHPEALVERALALGYRALALTDHDELGGIVAFAQAGYNDGLECIVGAEVTVEVPGCGMRDAGCDDCPGCRDRDPTSRSESPIPNPQSRVRRASLPLCLLAPRRRLSP